MAKLVIEIDIDVDPTLEDPHEVAQELLGGRHDSCEDADYAGVTPDFVKAEWRADD